VERSTVTFVNATTENPSFALNAALLSRAGALRRISALSTFAGPEVEDLLTSDARDALVGSADGDGRFLLRPRLCTLHRLNHSIQPDWAVPQRRVMTRTATVVTNPDFHACIKPARVDPRAALSLHECWRRENSLYVLQRLVAASEDVASPITSAGAMPRSQGCV
jgi:putative ATPase